MKRLLIVAAYVCLALASVKICAAQETDKSARVDALMSGLIQADGPGAAVLVMRDGRVVHSKGYGLARLETKEPVGPNTAFEIGSTSKQFTAMAVMILQERGRLSFDDPLAKFFPEFPPYAKAVTVRHLLIHTSGLIDIINPNWFRKGYEPTAKELLRQMAQQKSVSFAPGEKSEYNNAGYMLLALIVEKASGQSFARFMRENIFKPLGMTSTFVYDETKPNLSRAAISYSSEEKVFKAYEQTSDRFIYGMKGVYSTLLDLSKWAGALESEQLVKAATLKQAFTSGRLNNGMQTLYGFGWYVNQENGLDVVEHAGGYLGYRATMRLYPAQHTAIFLLSNNDLIEPTPLARKIAEIYLADRMQKPVGKRVDVKLLQEYVGRYEGDPNVMQNLMIDITLENEELYITSPIKPKTKLLAQSDTLFNIAETASNVTFNRDDKGAVVGLTLMTRRGTVNARKVK
ncbi:MAG: serine hydrolase [Acidobacteria bacterium]|nr:serine hydrolase [Acidobacteriota bacterium]